MKNQIVKYNIDPINNKFPNAQFYLIMGQKSNGKSYQVKHKEAVLHYLNTKMKFVLLRRWREDISTSWIEKYFSDVDIEKITNGKYNAITTYRKDIYLSNILPDLKVKRGEMIGTCIPLSGEQHYSSASFLDYDRIIFEEFMERGFYLPHESEKLEILYNTIDRGRGITKCYMVGNTISRVCPYLNDWKILDTIRSMKQGDIVEVKTGNKIKVNNQEIDTSLVIEYCKALDGANKIAFGSAKSMIDGGAWQTSNQPKLTTSKNDYKMMLRIGFDYKGFRFIGEFLTKKDVYLWFIYPYSKEFTNIIVFSDVVKQSKYYFRDIYNMPLNRELGSFLERTFRESNIFFSDDLCGTDFKQAIDFSIRK